MLVEVSHDLAINPQQIVSISKIPKNGKNYQDEELFQLGHRARMINK